MMLGANFKSALEALEANSMRSFLTMLGVIMGIAAVISAVTLTQGVSASINQNLASLGTNTLTVVSSSPSTNGTISGGLGGVQTITLQDAQAIANLPNLVATSPVSLSSGQAVFMNQNWNTKIQGVYPEYQTIQGWQLSEGSWFTQQDETGGAPVAVLGQTVVDSLFTPTGVDPIGQTIRINRQNFRVVGTLQIRGGTAGNVDDVIYIPFTTATERVNGPNAALQVQAMVDDVNNVNQVVQDITTLLQQRHHILANSNASANDFRIYNSNQIIQTRQQSVAVETVLLVGIAAISLTVGGVGIMNIMLVSVTERTGEIGVRMAVGARQSDIRNQFLIESLTLSAIGGIFGILFGLCIGLFLNILLSSSSAFSIPYVVDPTSIILSFSISAIVGVIFGLYPAIQASKLDPIVALRTE
jgi:putative ABC transport system permease protein